MSKSFGRLVGGKHDRGGLKEKRAGNISIDNSSKKLL